MPDLGELEFEPFTKTVKQCRMCNLPHWDPRVFWKPVSGCRCYNTCEDKAKDWHPEQRYGVSMDSS
ncbi:MAG: hypothetical protein D6820_08660 [Lentisphaerae bacterium]|nr:MAG: hypothetical protein D6820_08660 [Lentisphaerota bacterium]